MLDFGNLQNQIFTFSQYHFEEERRQKDQLDRALLAFYDLNNDWEDVRDRMSQKKLSELVAIPLSRTGETFKQPRRPAEITVVATDGSQIFPDRHTRPTCYLLNVSQIAFQYGTTEKPIMRAKPTLGYRQKELEDLDLGDLVHNVSAEVVSAIRDQMELSALFEIAEEAKSAGRPILAIADGTLIRWMLRGMKNHALEQTMIAAYTEVLDQFREAGIPICSYISLPGNTEIVNLLRFSAGEYEEGSEQNQEDSLAGLRDRQVFDRVLNVGERSTMFESGSKMQASYGTKNPIQYFFVKGETEIGRVEMPRWVAENEEWVSMIHATIMDQIEKGKGYPIILSESHEWAVIRGAERQHFYDLIQLQLGRAGKHYPTSSKQQLKNAPMG